MSVLQVNRQTPPHPLPNPRKQNTLKFAIHKQRELGLDLKRGYTVIFVTTLKRLFSLWSGACAQQLGQVKARRG
jgi:hypothetical protein